MYFRMPKVIIRKCVSRRRKRGRGKPTAIVRPMRNQMIDTMVAHAKQLNAERRAKLAVERAAKAAIAKSGTGKRKRHLMRRH